MKFGSQSRLSRNPVIIGLLPEPFQYRLLSTSWSKNHFNTAPPLTVSFQHLISVIFLSVLLTYILSVYLVFPAICNAGVVDTLR